MKLFGSGWGSPKIIFEGSIRVTGRGIFFLSGCGLTSNWIFGSGSGDFTYLALYFLNFISYFIFFSTKYLPRSLWGEKIWKIVNYSAVYIFHRCIKPAETASNCLEVAIHFQSFIIYIFPILNIILKKRNWRHFCPSDFSLRCIKPAETASSSFDWHVYLHTKYNHCPCWQRFFLKLR